MSNKILIIVIMTSFSLLSAPALGQCPLASNSTWIDEMEKDLKLELKDLWEDQIIWTQMQIIAVADNSTDKEAIVKRLMKNSEKIGDTLKPYYSEPIGEKYGELVKEITLDAVALAESSMGKINAIAAIDGKTLQSIGNITNFENSTNPYWDIDARKKLWDDYLNFTKSEALISSTNNRTPDLDTYDRIEKQADLMADSLAEGTIMQYRRNGGGVEINRDECVSCGSCVEECPEGALILDDNGIAVVNRLKCTECKICVEACPTEAISIF